ncbi:hypothetical protein K474DRAFT_1664326 [Panus rudis PR-1116 ss-1]|nr:hypothetical protein K474DRAFT_1664326 [Panus rudis PR-1116 ss-1]
MAHTTAVSNDERVDAIVKKVSDSYNEHVKLHGKPADRAAARTLLAPLVDAALQQEQSEEPDADDVKTKVLDKSIVALGWGDYGCYFYIENVTDTTLEREGWDATWGEWVGEPPKFISSNKMSPEMHIRDKWGPGGSDGWVKYDARGETLTFRVACQEVGSNIVEASSSAGKNSRFVLDVPAEIPGGHPLDDGIIFAVMNKPM